MDTATTVAVFGFLGAITTSSAGAAVAIFTNRAEKQQTAEDTVVNTLRERIILRDEQIQELRVDLEELRRRKPCHECILFQTLTEDQK